MKQATAPEATIPVCTATLDGAVHLKVEQFKPVSLRRGSVLAVQVPYTIRETSHDREGYSLQLQCTVAESFSQATPTYRPAIIDRWGDRRGRDDSRTGALSDAILFDRPGEYTVEFAVEAEYTVAPWSEARIAQRDGKKASGLLRIHVV